MAPGRAGGGAASGRTRRSGWRGGGGGGRLRGGCADRRDERRGGPQEAEDALGERGGDQVLARDEQGAVEVVGQVAELDDRRGGAAIDDRLVALGVVGVV